jgi:hypothetical protein
MFGGARIWNKVTIIHKEPIGDREIVGSWSTKEGLITVKSQYGEKTTQTGGSRPEFLAKMMLQELAKAGKA